MAEKVQTIFEASPGLEVILFFFFIKYKVNFRNIEIRGLQGRKKEDSSFISNLHQNGDNSL